ncbi:MAG TPA: DNA polymerase III subunit gamma/tau [Burkholderiales bacterium]|jgi:DNA polymerase-3 subunit gamma/tau|nr:DNA polymerase III subunit gamma/tau [Burkholderiales bacterium]
MSYQVLARKWRPRNFESLVGQEHVVRALRHALDENRLHHAYLFSGTRGVGKTTLARILAKCLNCETGISSRPCGKCSACLEIDSGRYVDLIEVDAATNTKVDEMRQLLENAVYAPSRGRFKVYVIDEVHMLSTSAFNAMLKTLEEPPEHVKFILATTDPQKIPVTVLSRCLQFNLKQMPAPSIASHLAGILGEEKIPAEEAALRLVAECARGSMRDALSLLDQAIAHGGGSVTEEGVRGMLGTIDDAYLYTILECVARGDARALLAVAEEMRARSAAFDSALQDLGSLLHRVALAQTAPDAVDAAGTPRERLLALAKAIDPEDVQLYYQIAIHGRQDLPFAPDEFAGFTMALLRMLAFATGEGGAGERTKSDVPRERPAPAPGGAQREGRFDGDWPKLANALNLGGVAKQLAQASELQRFDGESLELCVPPAAKHLAEKSFQDKLRGALQDHFGKPMRLTVRVGETGGNTARDRAAAAISQDAFVRDLVENLDATIVESSIKPTQ